MTRSFLAGVTAALAVAVLTGTGCQSTGVGDPCTPEQEYDPSFLGFAESEVSIESKSFQCETRLCLVNHFQGRVSCPYGQNMDGTNISGTQPCNSRTGGNAGCCTPGIDQPVTGMVDGMYSNPMAMAQVLPQCDDRPAADAVYCSCRCANVNGQTNDGYNYCTCPSGFSCTQLVSSIGSSLNQGLNGAYCIKDNTTYNPTSNECTGCTPAEGDCGSAQGVTAGH